MSDDQDQDWLAERLRWIAGDIQAGVPVDYQREALMIRLKLMLGAITGGAR